MAGGLARLKLEMEINGDKVVVTGLERVADSVDRAGRNTRTATGQMASGMNNAETATGKMAAWMGKAEHATGRLTKGFSELQNQIAGLISGFSLAVIVRESIQAALMVEKINAAMTSTAGSGTTAARELSFVREEANRLGLVYGDTALAYAKFSAATKNTTIEGDATRKIFVGVSEAVTALKLSGEESNGIFLALSQMMSKGKISAEELSGQLGERLPGAVKLTADAMGLTTQELLKQMQEGKLMSSDVLPKLADQLHKTYGLAAIEAAQGGQAEINRFNNALFETKAALGTALMPTFTSMLNNVIKPLTSHITAFIGRIEILAVKFAALPDRIAAAWNAIKSFDIKKKSNEMYSGLQFGNSYQNATSQIDANVKSSVADIMKKNTPASSQKSATDLAAEQAKVAEARRKEAEAAAKAAADKAAIQEQKLIDDRDKAATAAWNKQQDHLNSTNPLLSKQQQEIVKINIAYDNQVAELVKTDKAYASQLYNAEMMRLQLLDRLKLETDLADQQAANSEDNIDRGKKLAMQDADNLKLFLDGNKAEVEYFKSLEAAKRLQLDLDIQQIDAKEKFNQLSAGDAGNQRIAVLQQSLALEKDAYQQLALTTTAEDQLLQLRAKILGIETLITAEQKKMYDATAIGGMTNALEEYGRTASDVGAQVKSAFSDAFNTLENSFTRFLTTGKLSLKSFFDSIKQSLAKMASQRIVLNIVGSLSTVGGSITDAITSSTIGKSVSSYVGSGATYGGTALYGTGTAGLYTAGTAGTTSSIASGAAATTAANTGGYTMLGGSTGTVGGTAASISWTGIGAIIAASMYTTWKGYSREMARDPNFGSNWSQRSSSDKVEQFHLNTTLAGLGTIIDYFTKGALFGTGWKTQAQGIQLGVTGGEIGGENYIDAKKKKSWFRGNEYATVTSALDDQWDNFVIDQYTAITNAIKNQSSNIGSTITEAMLSAVDVAAIKISLADKSAEDQQKAIATAMRDISNQIIEQTMPALREQMKLGEDFTATLMRLNILQMTNNDLLMQEMELQGKDGNSEYMAMLNTQREYEMLGLDETTAAIKRRIFVLQDEQSAIAKLTPKLTSAVSQTMDLLKFKLEVLRQGASPGSTYQLDKAAFARSTKDNIIENSQRLLESSRNYFASGSGYQNDKSAVLKMIDQFTGMSGGASDVERQIDILTQIQTAITDGNMELVKQLSLTWDGLQIDSGAAATGLGAARDALEKVLTTPLDLTAEASAAGSATYQLNILNDALTGKDANGNLLITPGSIAATSIEATIKAIELAQQGTINTDAAAQYIGTVYQTVQGALTNGVDGKPIINGTQAALAIGSAYAILTSSMNPVELTGAMNVLGTAVTIGMENAQNAIDGIPVFNLTPVLTSIAEGYNVAVSSVITSPVESLSGLLSTFAASVTTSAVNAETAITKVLTALDMIGNYNDTVTNARATNDMHMQEKAAEYTMTALKMGSGKLPTDLRYDLTGDGLVDAGDAILWKAISEGKRKWSSFGLPTFAEGGIAIGPSIAGEGRYREAIIPLPDGRNVPVVMQGSADNKETVAELKETNRQLAASIRVLQAGFTQLVEQVASGNQNGKVIAQKTTLKAAA